jgi:GNAT superfamily N-acetyltransferase
MSRVPTRLKAQITHLEMAARPSHRPPAPVVRSLALMRTRAIPLAYYRYLYSEVGKAHHWMLRRRMDDWTLSAIIHAPATRIDVLYVDGCPAGFFELDSTGLPHAVELVYFGLTPDFTGQGLGRWFLSCAVEAAWDFKPNLVTVHTNTLDHPRALALYQQAGFAPVGRSEEEVDAWE